MKLTEAQRKEFYWDEELGDLVKVGTQDLGLDSHGCLCKIFVFSDKKKPDELFGFMVRESSEESFFDDKEIYALSPEQVTVTQYRPTNYPDWKW